MKRFSILFLTLALSLNTQAQAYMDSDLPDVTKMLPAYPDTKSLDFVNDYTQYRWGKSVREESTGKLAYSFIMWDFNNFLRSLGKAISTTISATNTPKLYALLEYAQQYADKMMSNAQSAISRQRPYDMFQEGSYVRSMEERLRNVSCYPCDQAVKGWLYSLLLAEVCPSKEETIYTRGLKYGPSMIIAGYNFESDVHAGHMMGSALLARMHSHDDFQAMLDAARNEMSTVVKTRAMTRASDDPYLSTSDLPNSDEYLPEPPAELSCQMSCDIVSYNEGKLYRQQDKGEQAVEDIEYSADHFCEIFSKVLGKELSASKTPAIYELVHRAMPPLRRPRVPIADCAPTSIWTSPPPIPPTKTDSAIRAPIPQAMPRAAGSWDSCSPRSPAPSRMRFWPVPMSSVRVASSRATTGRAT